MEILSFYFIFIQNYVLCHLINNNSVYFLNNIVLIQKQNIIIFTINRLFEFF